MNNNSHPSNKFSNSFNPDLEETIPESIKSESFMLWRLEQREGRQTKPPINPSSGYKGNVQDPKQWTDFANALKIHKGGEVPHEWYQCGGASRFRTGGSGLG